MSEFVSVPTAEAHAALDERVAALEALHAEPEPEPEPEPAPAEMTNLTAVAEGEYVYLTWEGATEIHLYADDYDANGDYVRSTDQGVVTGNSSDRGPMGDLTLTYVFSARVVAADGTLGEELYEFPPASFDDGGTTTEPVPADDGGTVSWSDTPDSAIGASRPYINWESAEYNINAGCTVDIVSDAVKGKAIRSFAPAYGDDGGSQRGEIVPDTANIQNGTELWLGFDLLIPEADGLAKSHQQVMQLKSYPSESSAVFSINVNNHREGLVTGINGDLIAPTPYAEWIRVVIGLNVVQGSDAWHEVWVDDVNTVPRVYASNMRDGDEWCYLKFLVYRDGGLPFDLDMRFARMAFGSTRGAVA